MCLWFFPRSYINMLCAYITELVIRATLSQQPLVRFTGELYEATRHPHTQQRHSFMRLPKQVLRGTVGAGWLQRSVSA